MRIEPLCRIDMHYAAASWHEPYRRGDAPGLEAIGFGQGDGEVTGEVAGSLVWANYPRRREDEVWMPNLRGVITTTDGEQILVSIRGQSVAERAPGRRRAVTARIELITEVDSYRWLNTSFLIGEGEIDADREDWWLVTYVCINEEAMGPPAIGLDPPPRFRQLGAAPS